MIQKRGSSYAVKVYDPRQKRKTWVGTYPTMKQAREAEAKAVLAHNGRASGRTLWTVSQFADRWLDAYHGPGTAREERTTYTHNKAALRAFLDEYGSRKLTGVERAEARDFAAEFGWRSKAVAAMFRDAVRDGKLDVSPFEGARGKKQRGRADIDPLTIADLEALASHAEGSLGFYGEHFAAFIRFAGWTGLRPGEMGGLEWHDVDLARRHVHVRRQSRNDGVVPYTKTRERRVVQLSDEALDVLTGLSSFDEYVFHTATGKRVRPSSLRYHWSSVRAVWLSKLREGDLGHWYVERVARNPTALLTPYEMRHCCGSLLADAGLGVRDIAAQLGNTPQVCEVYIHDYRDRQADRIRDALVRVGSHPGSTTERKSA